MHNILYALRTYVTNELHRDPERAALVVDGVRQLNAVKLPVLEQRMLPAVLNEDYFYDRIDDMDKGTSAKLFAALKEVNITLIYQSRGRE